MNFSNYVSPYFPFSALFEQGCYGYPCFSYLPPLHNSYQRTFPTLPETQPQIVSRELDKEKLIQKLKMFHEDEVHHKKTHWTYEQDKLLQKLVEVQRLEWKEIPKYFEGRTQNMCYSRYRRILMSTKQRSWSKQQEDLVLELINRYGQKWKLISSKMPKFTSKQIRERYLNYLRPNINKEDFTFEEDLKICQYVLAHGNHWREMEDALQGRPEGLIKGRYYGRLQKIIEQCYKDVRK